MALYTMIWLSMAWYGIIYAQTYPAAPSNTGITTADCPNWAANKANTSGRNITTAGAVIDYEEISGPLNIRAANVTLSCVKINAGNSPYGLNCISANPSGSCPGLISENVEVHNCSSSCVYAKGTAANPALLSKMYIHDSEKDLLKPQGDLVLEYSYLADFSPSAGAHNDAAQISSGGNMDIRYNKIIGPYQEQTSAIIAKTDFGPTNRLRLLGNYFSGGTFTIYLRNGGFGAPTNVVVANNVWQRDSWKFGSISTDTNASHCLEWYGNTFDDAGAFGSPTSTSPKGSCQSFGAVVGNTQAKPASFTPAPGSYQTSVTVSISTPETGATIRYTLDGSTPDGADPAYTVPLTFVATTTLKAIVIKSGLDNSVVTTGVYTISGGCTY